jgi:hypothetical protein
MSEATTRTSAIDRLAAAFIACTLPKAEWTHEAHLRVGLWHRLHMPAEEALAVLRERISRYNVSQGGENTDTDGYHETITRLYVILIDRFVSAADASRAPDELAHELIIELGHRDVPFRHYPRERLFSLAARRAWVAPDFAPLAPGPLA